MIYFAIFAKNIATIFQLQLKIGNISDMFLQYSVLCGYLVKEFHQLSLSLTCPNSVLRFLTSCIISWLPRSSLASHSAKPKLFTVPTSTRLFVTPPFCRPTGLNYFLFSFFFMLFIHSGRCIDTKCNLKLHFRKWYNSITKICLYLLKKFS